MEKYISEIRKNPLFHQIEDSDITSLLKCLNANRHNYKKNEYIFSAGDSVKNVGIVLTGRINVLQEDYWGNRKIIANIGRNGLFGEAFSCAEIKFLPVSVIATENTEIFLFNYQKILTTCSPTCVFHATLIKNMLRIIADKNVMLTQKMEVITSPSTRESILAYLSYQAIMNGSNIFTIPFDRQELADYLSVNRSAMSRELSKMQEEGLINTNRSNFELLTKDLK